MKSNTIPNLDAMTQEELRSFWLKYQRPSRKDAEALIGDRRPGFTKICGTLAGYASNKETAMSCRLKGDIQAAEIYEKCADMAYERLPEDLRW